MSKVIVIVTRSIGEENVLQATSLLSQTLLTFMGWCDVSLNQDPSAALWYPEALIIKLCV